MALLLIGLATLFNFIIIVIKFKRSKFVDGTLDFILMVVICRVFGGSFDSLVVGMVASMGISIFLWFFPVTMAGMLSAIGIGNNEDEYEE